MSVSLSVSASRSASERVSERRERAREPSVDKAFDQVVPGVGIWMRDLLRNKLELPTDERQNPRKFRRNCSQPKILLLGERRVLSCSLYWILIVGR